MRMRLVKMILALVLSVSFLLPGASVFASGGEDTQLLREEIEALKKDVSEIKRVLISVLPALVNERGQGAGPAEEAASGQRVEAPTTAVVSIGESPVLGNKEAKVAIVEFSDYQCPFCARFHFDAYGKIKEDFIDTGKILFVHKDFPLPFHEDAMPAALASRCAEDQGKYWEMHDLIFESGNDLGEVEKIAEKTGLDLQAFRECMKDEDRLALINADLDDGRKAGVRGTPTFVIGKIMNGTVSGEVLPGAAPYAMFRDRLNSLLSD